MSQSKVKHDACIVVSYPVVIQTTQTCQHTDTAALHTSNEHTQDVFTDGLYYIAGRSRRAGNQDSKVWSGRL
jgi:hypothetical protein